MNNFWNERYAEKVFAYGIAPNEFYKEQLAKLPKGKILFAAEGEGRNAVYAAQHAVQRKLHFGLRLRRQKGFYLLGV